MAKQPTERDPLITLAEPAEHQSRDINGKLSEPRRLGPLEISKSTRYGILAGIWTATFLSVRPHATHFHEVDLDH